MHQLKAHIEPVPLTIEPTEDDLSQGRGDEQELIGEVLPFLL
jgi:hypothetical protein